MSVFFNIRLPCIHAGTDDVLVEPLILLTIAARTVVIPQSVEIIC